MALTSTGSRRSLATLFRSRSSTAFLSYQNRPPLSAYCELKTRPVLSGMASDNESDEDLRRAIALSLQDESEKGSSADQAIALDDDDLPISRPAEGAASEHGASPCGTQTAGSASILGLNRKQMEEERLARKRKASSPPPTSEPTINNSSKPAKRQRIENEPRFLDGTVMRTWARGHSKASDMISLPEILDKENLQMAVLSSFQWDIPWLFDRLNVSKTLVTLVMQAKDDAIKQQYRQETIHLPNLRLCFPSMDGQINCMHSKLMLLSHPKYLRIVIPTANLVSYDWGETGDMENMAFIIDLPRLPDGPQAAEDLTFFGKELVYFLNAQGLERSIVNSLYKFDFSATRDLAFVHTIGGAHSGAEDLWRRTGYSGLGRAVKALGLHTKAKIEVDFVTSSVGSLNLEFLSHIYRACQGDEGEIKTKEQQVEKDIEKHFRVYFPTRDTVRSSTAGSAGTICFQSKWYNSPTFPKDIMRDCKSVRPGMLMHNKLLLVQPSSTSNSATGNATAMSPPPKSWAYIGSANCSESAWGKMSKDRSTKLPKLNCRNWECGVLLPTRVVEDGQSRETKEVTGGAPSGSFKGSFGGTFAGIVPIPMVYPGDKYAGRKPWYYAEN